jgi:hypothetical protein
MKSFEEFRKEISLVKSSMGSEFGSKYIDTKLPRNEMIVVRHLDTKLAIELFPIYEQLYNTITKWVDDRPKVNEYVFIPSLIEVGKDYFIRPFYVYDIAIRDYMDKDDEDYVEPPALFEEMRNSISQELNKEVSGRELIIHRILKKSLLEPTGKTIYDSRRMNKFIIVEPKISLDDLNEWKQKSQS